MKERRKYIALNAGAWLATLVAGLFVLAMLRGVGVRLTVQHNARTLLADARAQLRAGNVSDAQRSGVMALAATASVVPDVIALAGGQLLGMPVLDERIRHAFAEQRPAELVLARYELVSGDPAKAVEPLRRYQQSNGKQPEPYLWLGRLYADQGDFVSAKKAYDKYWMLAGGSSRKTAANNTLDGAWRLFEAGLWQQAAVVPSGWDKPEWLFFIGLGKDIAGDTTGAMESYKELLQQRPAHFFAVKRVDFLTQNKNSQ
jgi:tetratricopeptide (TPR) repeat protein